MLSSPENWFWDFWFARNESEYHIFYLQAPKSLEYEEQRHHNATIGHAVSKNLFQWQVLEPITDPGEFGQLEIPQLVNIKDIYYLLFSTSAEHYSAHRIKHTKNKVVTGTHFLVSNNPLGPFTMSTDRFLLGNEIGLLYGGKIIQTHDGAWRMMAFCNYTEDGNFLGTITDPFSINFD